MGGSSQTTGWNYRLAWLHMLGMGPWDTFLEFRGADKVIWKGRITGNTALALSAPKLWGGDKDQGGVQGTLRLMFGEADQLPNAYATATWGPRTAAYRGFMTAAWEGGIWGANNPWAQKCSYRGERYNKGWDNDDPWYPEKCPVPIEGEFSPGTPGAGTYRWAFKMGGTPTLSVSPDGIDWTDTTTYSAAFYTAEVTFPVGERLVSINAGGSTKHADWTTPGTWIVGPSAGASSLLNPYACVINGRTFVARGAAGYSISDNVTVAYEQFAGSTNLFLGNADLIVRCRGGAAPTFFVSADSGDTFVEGVTIERSFDPSDADYAFDIYAGAASDSAYAVGGRDYHGEPVIFRSVDGFMTTPTRATLPPGLLGQIYELFRAPGLGWLAFLNNTGGGDGALLRSTDDALTFQIVDLGTPVNFGQVYQGNCALDARDGRVLIAAQTPGGGKIFQTDDYDDWFERDYVAPFGPATIMCIAPYDPGTPAVYGRRAKNPAHMILERHTQQHAGRRPRSSVNLDHLTVAADWFYSRGFGLCTTRNSKDESPRGYIKRIEKVAGCSFTQSLDDGLFYLDVANGIYDLETLEVINDDHVLKFKETGTVPDNAVNSVSVKYFDPERKEAIISPPVRAMGLIAQFGEIHQTFEYPEVPIGRIALEIATRELLARITPTRTFELDCNPGVYRLRKNQYVRLQLPRRGIADMVCIVGDIPTSGSLKSGAFQLKLTQDIYSLPTTEYVVELGEDTRPPSTPALIVDQVAFEAPYIDVVASMPAADFVALPADAGYVVGAAVDPGRMRDFTMMVAPDGGEYDDVGDGEFSPSCTSTGLVEPGLEVGIGYSDPSRMASVQIGDLGYWLAENGAAELVRVDAHDMDLQTLDLGRGCGDTIPKRHLAGSRIFFYQSTAAFDRTQHIAGEALDVKLLTNSYSQQLDLVDATELPVTMAQRIDRPYNNGKMEINGVSIFAIGTSTPGGGGGGGPGGGGPTAPPAQSPGGGPASPVPGPNGGFPDDAPYPIPQPPVGGDVIDDGGFDTPGYPTGWTNADGTPLDSRWFVGSDGKLHYQGVGSSRAYYLPARFSLPWQPVPRYDIAAEADIATDSLVKAAVGAAWGVSTSGGGVAYESVSEMKSYPVEQTVPHSFIYAPSGLVAGFIYTGLIPIVTFVPVLIVESDSGLVVNATFDNVAITPTIIPMPTTPEPLPNLDFSSGLDEWSLYPDPTGNEHAPTIAVSGGELSMTTNSPFWKLQNFIHDTPLSLNDIGRYTGTTYEGWSNDTTVINGVTQGGAIVGFAGKYLGAVTGIVYSGAFQRGDWTERETWLRQHVDGSVPGLTLHHLCALRAEPTFTSAIRNQVVVTTDDIIDPVPIP